METGGVKVKTFGGNVGSYAISTVGFDAWDCEPLSQSSSKTKKIRCKEVINKVFADCAETINDPYWTERFTEASVGKFPRKFSYKERTLSFKKGLKYITVDIPTNPYLATEVCIDFFRNNGGLFSDLDKQNSLELRCSSENDIPTNLTWGEINKKTQECMISYYVTDVKPLMGLTSQEVEQLRQTIYFGVSNKYFDKDNITVEKNRIRTITGLLWNSNERIFYVDPEISPSVVRSYSRKKETSNSDGRQKDMVPQFYARWRKYTDLLNNTKSSETVDNTQLTNDSANELITTKDDIDTDD